MGNRAWAVREAAQRLLDDVPGCNVTDVIEDSPQVIDVHILGWGPTLHPMNMMWPVRPRPETIEQDLFTHVARQQARRGYARELGLSDTAPASLDDVGHVAMDRVAMRFTDDPTRIARDTIAGLATGFFRSNGHIVNGTTLRARDAGVRPPHPRLAVSFHSSVSRFDGETLVFPGDVPQTVCSAAIGRRLADVVQVDRGLEDIAERKVVDMVSRSGCVHVIMRGDWVPLSQI